MYPFSFTITGALNVTSSTLTGGIGGGGGGGGGDGGDGGAGGVGGGGGGGGGGGATSLTDASKTGTAGTALALFFCAIKFTEILQTKISKQIFFIIIVLG